MNSFKILLTLGILGVAVAFMGQVPPSPVRCSRSRGRIMASLADLQAKALSKPADATTPAPTISTPVKQSGFSLFGKPTSPAPPALKNTVVAKPAVAKATTSPAPAATKGTVAAKPAKTVAVKVTKDMAKVLTPAAVTTKVKSGKYIPSPLRMALIQTKRLSLTVVVEVSPLMNCENLAQGIRWRAFVHFAGFVLYSRACRRPFHLFGGREEADSRARA